MLVNTPPMGWNTWNTFGSNITDKLVRESADKFVELGLDKAGYQYVVIDDCWSERDRDAKTHKILASKEKFPKGMKPVAKYVHSKGLKFGMYSCAGVRTCADYPGSFDHEFLDAETFAEIGVDYLKYDFCFFPDTSNCALLYRRMGNALRACGRDILFSACNWGSHDVWSWIRSTGAHMYRSTGDIQDNFKSFTDIAKSQMEKYCFSGPQCFNDMDMLTVGMYGKGLVGTTGCDLTQYKNQFALWCLMGSPLMLGCDIRKLDKDTLALITNPELIAFDQDPEARGAFVANSWTPEGSGAVLVKLLADGDLAVGFFNFTENKHCLHMLFEKIGFPFSAGYDLDFNEVISGEKWGVKQEKLSITLDPFDCRVFRVKPVKRA